mgnify:CR=1 FL=1
MLWRGQHMVSHDLDHPPIHNAHPTAPPASSAIGAPHLFFDDENHIPMEMRMGNQLWDVPQFRNHVSQRTPLGGFPAADFLTRFW